MTVNEHQLLGSHFIGSEIATLLLVSFRSHDCEFVANPVLLSKRANHRKQHRAANAEIKAGLQGPYRDGTGS
jgi:hypothetical protein